MKVKLLKILIRMSKIAIYGIVIQMTLYSFAFALETKAQKSLSEIQIQIGFEDVSLTSALKQIEKATDFQFAYRSREIPNVKISINNGEKSLNDLLKNISQQSGISFRRIDKVIHVKPGDLQSEAVVELISEQVSVSGVITDENGEGLPGASILEKGSSNGTITDVEGSFTLTVSDNATLIMSFVGYEAKEIELNGQTILNVSLEPDISALDEVVVIGYGTEVKSNLTGAVSSIKNKELTVVPTANTSSLLAGRIPGVITKQNSGLPGSDNTTINIRGYGTPLVLIDGVELEDGLNRIDPNEIESMTVLKDAAAAVYGARAANGVILVTSKRGKAGKPTITYDGSLTLQEATSFQEYVNPGQYVELVREADFLEGGDLDLTFTQDDLDNYRTGAPGFEGGDWVDALINNFAPMQKHNLSVSGGSDNVKYFTSIGTTDQESYFRERDHDYQRQNVRSNIDVDVNKFFSFNLDLSFRHDYRNTARGIEDIFIDLGTAQPIYPTTLPDPSVGVPYTGFSQRNPVAISSQDYFGWNRRHDYTFTGQLGFKYKLPFVKGLELKGSINTVQLNRQTKVFNNIYNVFQYDPLTGDYIDQGQNRPTTRISDAQLRQHQIYPSISLNYEKEFGDHFIKVLALGEQISRQESFLRASRTDLLSPSIPEIFSGSEDFDETDGSSSADFGRKSFVGRLNYRFVDRYLFEATFRADGNVLFAPSNRWGYFPSFSVGWVMSEEGFLQGTSNVLDYLKIRAAYSRLGNDRANGIFGFDYLGGYSQFTLNNNGDPVQIPSYMLGGVLEPSIRTLGIVNPNLTWVTATTYNFGLEAAIFQGKLQLETDIFYREVTDILGQNLKAIPSTFGGELPLVNLNSQSDRGVELKLNYHQNVGLVKLTVSPNVTYVRKKWGDKFDEEDYTDPDQLRINGQSGQWINRNFGYLSDGIFMSQDEIDNHPVIQDDGTNSTLRPGDIRYIDLDGNDTINFRDQDIIAFANNLPELVYGMNISAVYKGFSLDVLFQGASRFSLNITGAARNMFANSSTPFSYHYDLRWQPDPDNPGVNINPDAELPAAGTTNNPNNNRNSDFYRKDVTYLRLRNINLTYTIPAKIVSLAGLGSIQFYAAAENLFTLSNLGFYRQSFDPESTGTNASRTYPIHRNYTMGVRVSF